jgi:hypothetical protein
MRRTPFDERHKSQQDELRIQEISQNSQTSGKSANRCDGEQAPMEKEEPASISQLSDDVWCGNSWQPVDGSDATTTRLEPGVQTKKRAR